MTFIRIKYYKFKATKKIGPENESTNWKNVILDKMAKQSLASVTLTLVTVLGIIVVAMFANRLNAMDQKQMFENQSMIIVVYLGLPATFAYLFVIMMYIKHKKLRKAVWSELKERLGF